MTTKTRYDMIPYQREERSIYDGLCFDPDQLEPPPEAMYQEPVLKEIMPVLAARFTDHNRRSDVLLSSNTFICYDRRNLNFRVGPDCYLAFGVNDGAIRDRRLYLPWEAGKMADWVLEVASQTTARHDVTVKRDIYQRIGVPEYWRFDITGGAYYGDPLAGDVLVNGLYRPLELTTEPDDVLKGYSPILGLSLCWHDGEMYFYDHETQSYLTNWAHDQETLREAQAELTETQAELRSERAGRAADQARIRELEQQIHRRPLESCLLEN